MTPTSRAQLAKMLKTFAAADVVDRFDVGALDHETERMSLREDWNRSQVWKAAGWIAARNTTGSSIYVRPARAIERHPWILVDDLTAAALETMKAGHPPRHRRRDEPGQLPGMGPHTARRRSRHPHEHRPHAQNAVRRRSGWRRRNAVRANARDDEPETEQTARERKSTVRSAALHRDGNSRRGNPDQ